MLSKFPVLLIAVLAITAPLLAEGCQTYVNLWFAQSFGSNDVYTYTDDGGSRQFKSTYHQTGPCTTYATLPTGSRYMGNSTYVSHESPLTSDNCLLTMENGVKTFTNGLQATITQFNGFKMAPEYYINDLDGQGGYDKTQGWQEAATTFGVADGVLVRPTLSLPSTQSVLSLQDIKVPAADLSALGFNFGDTTLMGAGFSDPAQIMHNCPETLIASDLAPCRVKATYTEPIDTFVVLYGIQQKSIDDPMAGAAVSELLMGCDCICTSNNVGTREVCVNVDGSTTQCTLKTISMPKYECDLLGNEFCTKVDHVSYQPDGASGPGQFACSGTDTLKVTAVSAFNPDPNFAT